MKYATLTQDVLLLLKNWGTNDCRTQSQLKIWPKENIVEQLGCDGENCLKLLSSEGYDDEPVLRFIKNNTIFECITNRQPLPLYYDDVMRIAHFFHLGAFQALLLLVKLRWEEYLKKNNVRIDLVENSEGLVHQYLEDEREFELLENTIKALDSYFDFSKITGFSGNLYSNLLRHIVITRIFFCSIGSREAEAFIDNQNELINLFKKENEQYNETFHARNKQWLKLVQTAEQLHLKLEEQRVQDAMLEKKWLSVFGEIYFKLLNADYSCQSIKQQIDIKKSNPQMTIEQVAEANKATIEANMEDLRKLESEIGLSHLFTAAMSDGKNTKVTEDMVIKYKKTLRSIWLKTHPDKLIDKQFTPEQLQTLQSYYLEVTEVSSTDKLLNPLTLERLEKILEEIDQIYENIGLNIPMNASIKGVLLKDKVEWLEKQIALLDSEIIDIKNQLYVLSTNSTIRQKTESLKTPEIIELTKKQMLEKYEELSKMVTILKGDLEKLFEA